MRALKYLNSTKNLGIVLEGIDGKLTLKAYADASFNCHPGGKSHTGVFITLGKGPILVKSVKQGIVAKSTGESELIAADTGATDLLALSNIIKSIDYDLGIPVLYSDNTTALSMIAEGSPKTFKTKYIAIKYFFIHDKEINSELKTEFIRTEDMIGDGVSKALQGSKYRTNRSLLLNNNDNNNDNDDNIDN